MSAKNDKIMKTYQPTHEEIAVRAREIWNSESQPVGRDHEIWLAAEQQLQNKGRVLSPAPRSARPKRAKEEASTLEEEADPIANDKLQERLSTFGAPPSRGATSL